MLAFLSSSSLREAILGAGFRDSRGRIAWGRFMRELQGQPGCSVLSDRTVRQWLAASNQRPPANAMHLRGLAAVLGVAMESGLYEEIKGSRGACDRRRGR